MAERLNTNRRPAGADRNTIRLWGLLCLVLGTVGYAVIQNGMLRNLSGQELLAAMQADSRIMGYATVAIVLNAINCCAEQHVNRKERQQQHLSKLTCSRYPLG